MSKFIGTLGTQPNFTGNTSFVIEDQLFKHRTGTRPLWDYACFGVSVTTSVGTGGPFSCYIVGDLAGITIPIAGITSIGSTTVLLLPIVNEVTVAAQAGTTQFAVKGIPTPRRVVFGNSAIVGRTCGAVVFGMLYSSD